MRSMSILASTILTGSSTLVYEKGQGGEGKVRVGWLLPRSPPLHLSLSLSPHLSPHLDRALGALDLLVRLVQALDQQVKLGVDVVLELGQAVREEKGERGGGAGWKGGDERDITLAWLCLSRNPRLGAHTRAIPLSLPPRAFLVSLT